MRVRFSGGGAQSVLDLHKERGAEHSAGDNFLCIHAVEITDLGRVLFADLNGSQMSMITPTAARVPEDPGCSGNTRGMVAGTRRCISPHEDGPKASLHGTTRAGINHILRLCPSHGKNQIPVQQEARILSQTV